MSLIHPQWDWVRQCPLAGGWCYNPGGCKVMLATVTGSLDRRHRLAVACPYRKSGATQLVMPGFDPEAELPEREKVLP